MSPFHMLGEEKEKNKNENENQRAYEERIGVVQFERGFD